MKRHQTVDPCTLFLLEASGMRTHSSFQARNPSSGHLQSGMHVCDVARKYLTNRLHTVSVAVRVLQSQEALAMLIHHMAELSVLFHHTRHFSVLALQLAHLLGQEVHLDL